MQNQDSKTPEPTLKRTPKTEIAASKPAPKIEATASPKEETATQRPTPKDDTGTLKYSDFDLHDDLHKSLERMKYESPTPIQEQAIPLALQGRDVMGSAQTGTGKTAAFAIPIVQRLLTNPRGGALVLTPTRELGKQIMDIMHQLLGPKSPINTAFIIGGEHMGKQFNQLKARPRLIVGTPGRINDHLDRGSMNLAETDFLVLDETDRMLDMGFTIQLERIFKHLPKQRQTLMFSATLPKNIVQMSRQYMNNPARIAVGSTTAVASNIVQEVVRIEQPKKYDELMRQLHEREGSVIVFIKTKHGADRMAKNLRRDGFTSEALHGDLKQNKRDKVMQNFRKMNFRVLIATDIAARGLDVPHIQHVVNYDLPQVAEDFIHRMGRTARAGADGSAISFVSSQDGRKWNAIANMLNPGSANDSGEKEGRGNGRRGSNGGGAKKFGRSGGGYAGKGKSFGAGKSGGGYAGNRNGNSNRDTTARDGETRDGDRSRSSEQGQKRTYAKAKPFRSDKPQGGHSQGNAQGAKSTTGGKPFGKAPSRNKSAGGNKSQNGASSGGHKPQGAKPQNGQKRHFRKDSNRAA